MSQSGPALRGEPKQTSICSVSKNGPALRGEPKRTSTSPPTAPAICNLYGAGHLTQGPVYTGMVLLAGTLPPPLEMLHKPKQNLEEEVLSWSIHGTLIQKSLPFMVMCLSHPAVKNLILYLIDD